MRSPGPEKYMRFRQLLRSRNKIQALQAALGQPPGSDVKINQLTSLKSCPGRSWAGVNGTCVNFHDSPLLTAGRIKTIVAGDNHLLAVTSKGRAFAHPVNLHANDYGQLGMHKLEVQNDSKDGTLAVDLIHKPVAYPFIRASHDHGPRPSGMSDEVSRLDDKSIRFFPYLFEIPVLRGVFVEQVAAGSNSSFARTNSGRVLAWGANKHGWVTVSQLVRLFST